MLFSAREKVLNNIKSRLFPIKNLDKISTREPTPKLAPESTKHKKSKLKLQKEFINEIITDEKVINDQIFQNYFKYENQLLLVKDLIRAKQDKNEKLVININDGLFDLKNAIIRRKILENENPKNVYNIVGKSSILIKSKKVKELKY